MIMPYSVKVSTQGFRPLSGNLIFQLYTAEQIIENAKVSVPYRGILFFNDLHACACGNISVSVPYRGILFFNTNQNKKGESIITFPSPIGESYFSIQKRI